MSEKSFTVHIDGNRQSEGVIPPDGVSTAGEWADQVASEAIGSSDVADREFSWKVDGDVADRGDKISSLKDGAFLELVEVTVLEETTPAAVAPEPITFDAVPDGSVDDVLKWVRGSRSATTWNEGWGERAQVALDKENTSDDPRKGVTEALERAIAEAQQQA